MQRRFTPAPDPTTNGSSPTHDQPSHSPRQQQQTSQSQTARSNGSTEHHHSQQAHSQNGVQDQQDPGNAEEHAEASGQCIDALFRVLQQPLLPSTCLWHVGWLLSQLLPHSQSAPIQLAPHQQTLLNQVGCWSHSSSITTGLDSMQITFTTVKLAWIVRVVWLHVCGCCVAHDE